VGNSSEDKGKQRVLVMLKASFAFGTVVAITNLDAVAMPR
jgi:hypothetical protein